MRALTCFEVKPRRTRWQREHDIIPEHRAYRICVNKADNDRLLDESKWPADITVSRWYSKKPAETDGHHNDIRSESDGDNERSNAAAETPAAAGVLHDAQEGEDDVEQMESNTTALEIVDLDDTTLTTTPTNNADGGQ